MPEFLNPFTGLIPGRMMSDRELARAIRLNIAAELEAVHLYEAHADATTNELARKVLQDVANEERVHIGEFLRLLNILLPDEQNFLSEGADEVDEKARGGAGTEVEESTSGKAYEEPTGTIGSLRT